MITAPSRPGIYARGSKTVDQILKAALGVLIDEGAEAFTLRRIAARCDLKVGNVSYHFPRKEMLIQVMLDEMLESYDKLLDEMVRKPGLTAEERLKLVIILCLEEMQTKRTTHLFTELWALANQSEFVADRVRLFYGKVHEVIGEYVSQINPALSPDDVHSLSLFISASMEGSTPFLGHQKPWANKMPVFTALAAMSFVHLAKTVTSRDLAGLMTEAA